MYDITQIVKNIKLKKYIYLPVTQKSGLNGQEPLYYGALINN